ncbi:MAG: hypothetical protein WHT45_02245 [Ignavibacterium sp.]
MKWDDVFKIITSAIISLGGGAAIVLAFSTWISKIWADKILEKDKFKYQNELEKLKKKYELEYDKQKARFLQYSNQQFELYNSLWSILVDLKANADELWNDASDDNLQKFAKKLKETKTATEKSRLFLDNTHYQKLKSLLNEFANYELGKTKLIELRSKNKIIDVDRHKLQNQYFIWQNEKMKNEYSQILEDISAVFIEKLKSS